MAIPKKLTNFLEKNKIKAEQIEHRTVYTAFDKATTLKVPQKIVGKTLTLRIDPIGKPMASYGASRKYALALIPANKNLDKGKFKKIASDWQKKTGERPVKNVNFVTEAWLKKNIKGVKVGAVPPFGNLWKLPTFIDKSLINQPKIILNGGDWSQSIKINPSIFRKITPSAIIGSFTKTR